MPAIQWPLHCPLCRRPITIVYTVPIDNVAPQETQVWRCPYCGHIGSLALYGKVTAVYRGHGDRT